jgi:hypothetical protein
MTFAKFCRKVSGVEALSNSNGEFMVNMQLWDWKSLYRLYGYRDKNGEEVISGDIDAPITKNMYDNITWRRVHKVKLATIGNGLTTTESDKVFPVHIPYEYIFSLEVFGDLVSIVESIKKYV